LNSPRASRSRVFSLRRFTCSRRQACRSETNALKSRSSAISACPHSPRIRSSRRRARILHRECHGRQPNSYRINLVGDLGINTYLTAAPFEALGVSPCACLDFLTYSHLPSFAYSSSNCLTLGQFCGAEPSSYGACLLSTPSSPRKARPCIRRTASAVPPARHFRSRLLDAPQWSAVNAAGEHYLNLNMIDIARVGTDPAQAEDMKTVLSSSPLTSRSRTTLDKLSPAPISAAHFANRDVRNFGWSPSGQGRAQATVTRRTAAETDAVITFINSELIAKGVVNH